MTKTMTIDKIKTALKKWEEDDKNRAYLLLSVEDERVAVWGRGNDILLANALATMMKNDEQVKKIVQMATNIYGAISSTTKTMTPQELNELMTKIEETNR